jgi:antitoxin component YwqK of YwqJK toxin-antitoxin module
VAVVTTQTRFLTLFFYCIAFLSCSNTIIIDETDLIEGLTTPQFLRQEQYTGLINTYYSDEINIKSVRKYKDGKKNGEHLGWWPNGNMKYQYYFKNDESFGLHRQWHMNGELFTVKNYKNGLEHGEQKSWDNNGNLMYKYIYNDGRKYGIQGSIICNGGNEMEILN